MITNWGEKIARKLAASGTISPEEIDLYGYGFFLLLSSTLYLVVVSIFGCTLGVLWESIIFYFLFSSLREYGKGLVTTIIMETNIMGIKTVLLSQSN